MRNRAPDSLTLPQRDPIRLRHDTTITPHRQTRFDHRRRCFKKLLRVEADQVWRELELLADGRLADAERAGDLALAHAAGEHGPQGDSAP